MRVKTFRGKSTTRLLEQVKRELGSEAIILSNRTVREKDGCICEIMAAVETDPMDATPQAQQPGSQAAVKADIQPAQNSAPSRPAVSRRAVQAGPTVEEELEPDTSMPLQWQREWTQIKGMLLGMAQDKMDVNALTPRQKQALDHLENEEVDRKVIMHLYQALRQSPDTTVLGALGEIVTIKPMTQDNYTQKMQAFTGPCGIGKTSSLIRAAVAYKKANPGVKICLVNVDGGQGKGRMILKHYAQLSDMAFKDIYGKDDVLDLIAASDEYDRIFIDMPGLERKGSMKETLATLGLDADCDIALHLVLAPVFSRRQIDYFVETYRTRFTRSLVWTKLDEAVSYGSMVNVAEISALPVSSISFGTGLRDHTSPEENLTLWKILFKHELPTPTENARSTQAA